MRSKILNGMKKVMQSIMGSTEEESERLLVQLAKDPNSVDAKEKIREAIEKMMSTENADKALPREQLKMMMKGLTQGLLVDDAPAKDGADRKENFDPEAVGKEEKVLVFPSELEGRLLDDKDYEPMKGLDRKEYFDWVNPPGFEAGAPGSPEADEEQEEEVDDVDIGYHADNDKDDENLADREYYPSDENAGNHDDVKEDFCLPGKDCKNTGNHQTQYYEKLHTDSDQSETKHEFGGRESEVDHNHGNENTLEDDGEVTEEDDEDKKREENDRKTEKSKDEMKSREHDGDEDEGMEKEEHGEEGEENFSRNEGDREDDRYLSEEEEEEEEESDRSCDDGECSEEDEEEVEWYYKPRDLTSAERKVQEVLDGEVSNETQKWMSEMMKIDENAYFLLNDLPDLDVIMTDNQLNGSNRVVADGLAADQECGTLLQLLDGEAKEGNGYKGKTSPHTKYENFEGLTVKDAVDAAGAGRIPLLYPTVYMHLAERSRQFVQRHFNLKSHLFFSYTHLVCRSAGPGILTAYSSIRRKDLSHPVHADNCQLDHKGYCHKRLPAFVWRDWSAILYLNHDFEGGEFIFANFNNTPQAQVNPKCGRLVGFSAGSENLHGVKGVIHGRRCALAMWYTLDPRFREVEFFNAADHLNMLYEKEYKQHHN
ncbi:uncharacterized protein LOC129263352 [Lytechinus pictus]|uniref:uncharacterized protein LOC129263352 n=1 Tax=Lytechinus pictus TaxID=7653 RepID=UPI0030B9C9BF